MSVLVPWHDQHAVTGLDDLHREETNQHDGTGLGMNFDDPACPYQKVRSQSVVTGKRG